MDSYGATDPAEFVAVAAEYFFERRMRMQKRHPELYAALKDYYKQDPLTWIADRAGDKGGEPIGDD